MESLFTRRAVSATLGLALLLTLAGCGRLTVESSPDTFEVPDTAASGIHAGKIVGVENFYEAATIVPVSEAGAGVDADLHQYTETAIALLERELIKRGTIIRSGAKTVTLKISNVGYNYGWTITYSLILTAQLSNAESIVLHAENSSPATAYRAIDGAIMRAVTFLLSDPEFQQYVNQ